MVSKQIAIPFILVLVMVSVSYAITAENRDYSKYRVTMAAFWVSFVIGSIGAAVYLSLLLMTEKDLVMLRNNVITNVWLMAVLFIFSGGFVSAITQTAAGILTSSAAHTVFMIGFGWQGALAGVAASSTRAELTQEIAKTENELEEEIKRKLLIVGSKEREIAEILEAFKNRVADIRGE